MYYIISILMDHHYHHHLIHVSLRFHSHAICMVSEDEMGWVTFSTLQPEPRKCGANVTKWNDL
jgi:hypothetical protein